ncbi:MAG: glycosyltransferase [Desulfovibrio sp.]|nr:glycosyltransferase [Desulfovibrio sp.]
MSDENAVKPLISVLMLTYNHGPYVAQAIESVLGQKTDFPFELIICDDASQDETQRIIKEFAAKDERVVLSIQPTNTKLGKNFADGCAKIRGKYVAFCEGDDYWTAADKLQKQVSFLEANPDFSIAAHKVQILDTQNQQPGATPAYIYKDCTSDEQRIKDGVFFADEALANYYFQTGSLVLRWLFPDGFPHWYRKRMMFDHFLFMLHAVEGKIKYFDEPMSVWRRHGGGYSWLQTQDKGLFFQKEGEDWIKLYENMDKFFSRRFHFQIRERILLALRAIADNCVKTGNIDQLRSLVNNYQHYFNEIQKDAILVDAARLAFPERPEFAPPWQTASSPDMDKQETPEPAHALGGFSRLAVADIPERSDSVWNYWTKDEPSACFFNLRSALMRYLWEKGVSALWLPSYMPPMLELNRESCQFIRKFYRVNEKLEPSPEFIHSVGEGEAVLTINYLGKPLPTEVAIALHERDDIIWIEDLAQSLDRPKHDLASAVIYSPRKLFGVPDGGVLVGKGADDLKGWLENKTGEVINQREDLLLKALEPDTDKRALDLFWQKSDMEHQLSRRKMSVLTEALLKRVPYAPIAEKRKKNWTILYDRLNEYCLWEIAKPDFTPFAFPFVAPASFPVEILHTLLTRANIVCQRMWHPLPIPRNHFPQEEALEKRLLLLPCDQSLDQKELERIAELSLKIINDPGYFSSKIEV